MTPINTKSFYYIYYAVQPDLPKQFPLLHFRFFIPFKILLRDRNLFTEHFLGFPAHLDFRNITGDIEGVRFEGGLTEIRIEAAGTTDTDFIATQMYNSTILLHKNESSAIIIVDLICLLKLVSSSP